MMIARLALTLLTITVLIIASASDANASGASEPLREELEPLFDPTGSYRLPDKISDADLTRALGADRQQQRNALLVLIGRVDVRRLYNFPILIRELQPTTRSVGAALAKSGLLTDPDPDMRRLAIEAAASIPSASDELILPIIEGLNLPTGQKIPDPAEVRWRSRVGTDMANSLGIGSDEISKPGYEFFGIRDAAGFAASRFGQSASVKFVDAMEPVIQAKGASFLGQEHYGTLSAYAKSGKSERLVTQLMDSTEQPYTRVMFGKLILGMDNIPPSTRARVEAICAAHDEHAILNPLQCSILAYRDGKHDEAKIIAAKLESVSDPSSPASHLRWSIAEALLYYYGADGQNQLRALVLDRGAASSLAANYICRLGPDAGAKVRDEVAQLAAALPEDRLLSSAKKTCFGSERAMDGRFAP